MGIKPKMAAFQLTAARRRLDLLVVDPVCAIKFQLTAARRRLAIRKPARGRHARFNSQPREGGWSNGLYRVPQH